MNEWKRLKKVRSVWIFNKIKYFYTKFLGRVGLKSGKSVKFKRKKEKKREKKKIRKEER